MSDIVDQLRGFCQIKKIIRGFIIAIVSIVCLQGCSSNKDTPWSSVALKAKWFAVEGDFGLREQRAIDGHSTHLFFDPSPFINKTEKTLNFIVTTPVNNSASYGIDILSGRKYRKHFYCSQKDVWEKFSGKLNRPPYTVGIVPRVLDQLGKMQKIYVFGRSSFYEEEHGNSSHRVRVIGGVVEEYCAYGNCIESMAWEKRLVLIAVDPYEGDFQDVRSLDQLKKALDWSYVHAFMQNGDGSNYAYGKLYPSLRVVGEFSSAVALNHLDKYSHTFSTEELGKIRTSCIKLYDHAWKNVGKRELLSKTARQYRSGKINFEVLKAKIAAGEKIDTAKIVQSKKSFVHKIREFKKQYGKEFQTCTDFVQLPHINISHEKHWFFVYLMGYFKLYRMGYYYNCNRSSWFENRLSNDGNRIKEWEKELNRCSEVELNRAFVEIPSFFRKLHNRFKERYRYIEYDSGIGGTHQKIHSWVFVEYKKLKCREKILNYRNNEESIFPKDVTWQKRLLYEEENARGIIY